MANPPLLSPRELARLISSLERGDAEAQRRIFTLYRRPPRAHVIGITGAPGCGKSTLIAALARVWRRQGSTVAILSVDPSSPFTGGAILGDRIRMGELSQDPGVFIRSMASRGAQGGVARAAADAAIALDAAGFERIVIETVGAGQSDINIVHLADTVVVVEAPGLGDDIQAIKAGILEIADVLVVNKADRPEAEATFNALAAALELGDVVAGHHGPAGTAGHITARPASERLANANGWRVPLLKVSALRAEGVEAVAESIVSHQRWQAAHPERRAQERAAQALREHLQSMLLRAALDKIGNQQFDAWAARCAARELHPAEAAAQLLAAVMKEGKTRDCA
ncbi:MAG: methylmalonyl Co-A mutase-associated GTPase MeaB [Thermoflexales bacterium]